MSEWQPIETAPKDFSPILAAAQGVQNTGWMIMVVRWAQVSMMFRSDGRMDLTAPDCEWVGEMGAQYGVPITHWMTLPEPPR